ncbi:hypothetical protein WN51_02503 [Melipona quadrifasciata]|uniref:Uncharacterized protein n=1 Tax=Melipona quadrifasciata TaxID=166423 RepID=A0A0M8ZT65_9HYME|nr:hypothetical protein WN51_02503 [Melipona quadrifasciata]
MMTKITPKSGPCKERVINFVKNKCQLETSKNAWMWSRRKYFENVLYNSRKKNEDSVPNAQRGNNRGDKCLLNLLESDHVQMFISVECLILRMKYYSVIDNIREWFLLIFNELKTSCLSNMKISKSSFEDAWSPNCAHGLLARAIVSIVILRSTAIIDAKIGLISRHQGTLEEKSNLQRTGASFEAGDSQLG